MKTNFVCLLLLFFLSLACSRGKKKAVLPSPDTGMHLQMDLSVSTDSLSGIIGQKIKDIVVSRNGTIYLADQSMARIDIVSPEGQFIGSIGQRGRGPGDFGYIKGIAMYNDTLYVLELRPNRLSVFRLDNRQLIRARPFPYITVDKQILGAPQWVYPLANGAYEFVFPNYTVSPHGTTYPHVTLSVFSHNLKPVNKVVRTFPPSVYFHYTSPKTGGRAIFSGFGENLVPRTFIAFDAKGNLYEARSDSIHIRVFNSAGKKTRDISYHYLPPLFTQKNLDSLVDIMPWQTSTGKRFFRAAIKQNHVNRWMAMQALIVDDKGHCWVELAKPGKKKTWLVFDTEGKLKWQFKLSPHVQLYVIQNHEAYGIWSKKGEYSRIVRYRIEEV